MMFAIMIIFIFLETKLTGFDKQKLFREPQCDRKPQSANA